MADNDNDVVYFRSGDGTPFTVPFNEAENTYNQGYNPIENDADIEAARTQLQSARISEGLRGEKAAPPTIEQVLQPYTDEGFKFYKDQGLSDEEARVKAQSAYATNKAYNTIIEADPAFKEAGDLPSSIGAYLEGLGGSATLDILPFMLGGVGRGLEALGFENNWLTPEAQQLRKEANLGAYRAGEITGFLGPGVSKLGLKLFPRLANVPVVGRVLGAGSAIDTATGGDIAGEVTARLLLTKNQKAVIKRVAQESGVERSIQRAVEKDLTDQAVVQTLKDLGASGGVIGALEKIGGAGAVALGTAAQGAVQGGIYGAMERGIELQRGALSEANAADYTREMLSGGGEGGVTGAVVGGAIGFAVPQALKVVGPLVQKTNDLLQYAAREFPIVSVPALGSVLGRFTKKELQESMMRDAESKAPAFVERIGKVADAVDDEINEFVNQIPDMLADYKKAITANLGLPPNLPNSDPRMMHVNGAVNAIRSQIYGDLRALDGSAYRKAVTRGRRTLYVTDRGELENYIANEIRKPTFRPDTQTLPLPAEYEKFRTTMQTHLNGLDVMADATRAAGGVDVFGGVMPTEGIITKVKARSGLGNIIGASPITPVPEYPRPFDYLPPREAAAQYGKQMQAQQAFAGLGQNAPPPTFGPISDIDPQSLLAQAGTAGGVATAAKILGSMAGLPATAIGTSTAYVGGSLFRPKEIIKTLHLIDLSAQKINQASSQFAAKLFGTTAGRAAVGTGVKIAGAASAEKTPPTPIYKYKDNLALWSADSKTLDQLTPDEISNRLERISRPLNDFSPTMASEAGASTITGIKLLRDKQDEIKRMYGYGRPEWVPPPQQALRYAKYSTYVKNPLQVLKDTEDKGFIPPEGLEVLQKVYPSILLEIKTNLVDEFARAVETHNKIDPKRKAIMEQFLSDKAVAQENAQQVKANQAALEQRKANRSSDIKRRMELEQGGLSPRK